MQKPRDGLRWNVILVGARLCLRSALGQRVLFVATLGVAASSLLACGPNAGVEEPGGPPAENACVETLNSDVHDLLMELSAAIQQGRTGEPAPAGFMDQVARLVGSCSSVMRISRAVTYGDAIEEVREWGKAQLADVRITVTSEPSDLLVDIKPYGERPEYPWSHLGRTPTTPKTESPGWYCLRFTGCPDSAPRVSVADAWVVGAKTVAFSCDSPSRDEGGCGL